MAEARRHLVVDHQIPRHQATTGDPLTLCEIHFALHGVFPPPKIDPAAMPWGIVSLVHNRKALLRGRPLHFSYYDDYRTRSFECLVCAWSGGFEQLETETFSEFFEGSCPQCGRVQIIVSFPTSDEIRRAAAKGSEEAKKMLRVVEEREKLDSAFEREGLKSPGQLPDLVGGDLDFVWDQEIGDGQNFILIRCGDAVVWREPAFYEGWPRFNQVKEILKERYGLRFKILTPTERSELYLYGDDLNAPQKISFT